MGRSVLYCRKCGARLAPELFDAGDAVLVDGRPLCVGCVETPVPATRKVPTARAPAPTPRRLAAVRREGHGVGTGRRIPARSSKLPLYLGLAAALGLAAFVLMKMSGGGSESPTIARPQVKAAPKPAAGAPPEREELAPPPLPVEAPALEPSAGEMEKELDALEKSREEACGKEEFASALALLEEARNRRTEAAWARAVEAKILQVRTAAAALFGPLKEKALDARRRGAADEVRAVVDRVGKWGLKDLSDELDKALGEVTTAGPANPVEAAMYARMWGQAMDLAADRDYPAAMRALEEASGRLSDKKLQGEAAGDMEILRLLRGAVAEAGSLFSKTPKGQKLAVDVIGAEGRVRKVEGVVSRAGPGWVEIKREGGDAVIDFGDLAARSVVDIFMSRPGAGEGDARLGAMLLLLEGDPEGAKAIKVEDIPEPFWNHARRRSVIRPGGGPSEEAARSIFRAILDPQRGWPEGQRRGGTAERCAALLEKFGATSFARRHRAAIERLMEPAAEYLFSASDMKGSGTFRRVAHPKFGNVWVVGESVSGAAAKDNYVELEFSAPEGGQYRGWIYAGGCCAEVLALYWQATDLREAIQKGQPPVGIEPGGNSSLALRNPLTGLPRVHAGHPGGPDAVKWGWFQLPLPKYPSAGMKKIRVLADTQGAAVAYAVISSTRSSPPAESRLKELEKVEEPAAEVPGKGDKTPKATGIGAALVAHWGFDEGDGISSADVDGRGFAGGLRKGASWGHGLSGTALVFDGKDGFFEVPECDDLDPPQITVTAWFCPEELRSSGNTRDWLVSKGRNEYADGHYALALDTKEKQPIAYINVGGGKDGCAEVRGPANAAAAGKWHHIALTYDGVILKLYFNGALVGARNVNKARTKARGPLIMGKRGDNWSKFKGRIDEVRLYGRALSAAEIQAVIRASGGARPK